MSDNQKESAKKVCIERNSSKEFQQNAQRAKVIKYGNQLVSEYGGFNEYLWNSRRPSHGTKYSKAIELVGSEEELYNQFQFNHDLWSQTEILLSKEQSDKTDEETKRKKLVKERMTEIHRETMKRNWDNKEFRDKKLIDLIKLNQDEEFREKSKQNLINYNKSQEHRELASKHMINLNYKQWRDNEFRERHAEIHRTSTKVVETARNLMYRNWSDPQFKEDMLNKSYQTKKKNGTFKSSKPEDNVYEILKKYYPDVVRQYKCERYPFMCDFYIPSIDTFIEYQGSWTHGHHPFDSSNPEDISTLRKWESLVESHSYYGIAISTWTKSDVKKRAIAKKNNLNYIEIFTDGDLNRWLGRDETNPDVLFGKSKEEVFSICKSGFSGTERFPANHPIWDCNVSGRLSPKEAWYYKEYLMKAIDNLFSVTHSCIVRGVEARFVQRIRDAFQSNLGIKQEVLIRFTVAKIAPKVTALSYKLAKKFILQSGLDISNGVYCPMAGFGGIIEASKDFTDKIEAYDINPNFCEWYGWTQRDVLSQVVHTDKTVIVCPPFDYKEQWNGTPDKRGDEYYTNYKSFEEWCRLIKKYVVAPQYIFIGPEESKGTGLFGKRSGVQYYPDTF